MLVSEQKTLTKDLKGTIQKGYFEPKTNDEDYPLEIHEERVENCQKLEKLYDWVFDENSTSIAKVNYSY